MAILSLIGLFTSPCDADDSAGVRAKLSAKANGNAVAGTAPAPAQKKDPLIEIYRANGWAMSEDLHGKIKQFAGAVMHPAHSAKADTAMPVPDKARATGGAGNKMNGNASYTQLDPGAVDLVFCTNYKIARHYVCLGKQLYLCNETGLTKTDVRAKGNSQLVVRDSVAVSDIYIPRKDATGWDAWLITLARAVADNWVSTAIGKEQVIIEVAPDGKIKVLDVVAFVPAVGKDGKFMTEQMDPSIRETFSRAVLSAIDKVSQSGKVKFPAGSTATKAALSITFNVDNSLNVWTPDLSIVQNVPQDQHSLWVARIASIFDSFGMFCLADHLRQQLPQSCRRQYVPIGTYNDVEVYDPSRKGPTPPYMLTPDAYRFLTSTIDSFLKDGNYRAAERLAVVVSADTGFRRVWLRQSPNTVFGPAGGWTSWQDHNYFTELDVSYVKQRAAKVQSDPNVFLYANIR